MTITRTRNAGAKTYSVTLNGTMTAGNRIVVVSCIYSTTADTPLAGDVSKSSGDGAVGSWSLDSLADYNPTGTIHFYVAVYSAEVTQSSSNTPEFTVSVGNVVITAAMEYHSDAGAITVVDGSNTGTGASGAPTTIDGTSSGIAVFVGGVAVDFPDNSRVITADGNFNSIYEVETGNTDQCGSIIDRISTGPLTDAASWTAPTDVGWAAAMCVYAEPAGATNITPAENSQAQAGDAVSVTFQGATPTVGPAEGTQNQSSDAVILTAIYPLTIAEGNQAQSSDKASFTEAEEETWYQTYWLTEFDQNQEAYVTMADLHGTLRLWGRMVNPTGQGVNLRGYYGQYGGGSVELHRYDDATSTNVTLGSAAISLTDGDKLWLRLEGATCQVYTYASSAWSKQIDIVDGSPALEGGYIGFETNDTDMRLDNFGGGNLVLSWNVTPAEGTQGQAGDAAIVYARYPLVGAENSQAQSGDIPVIAALHPIAPVENSQVQAGDACILTAIHPITAAEGAQAQASDLASITSQAPTYSITGAEGTQSQSSDAAILAAIHPVTPAEGMQAQASDLATIGSEAPSYAVTPSENAQTQSGDAVILAVVHLITPAENSQAQAGDICSLSTGNIFNIAPAENNQAQTCDAAAIKVIVPITASEGTQAQSGDIATFNAIYLLTGAENTQSQSSDACSISFSAPGATNITPAQGRQAQSSDTPILAAVYKIAPVENTQGQSSDLVVISPAAPSYNIVPAEMFQAQSCDSLSFITVNLLAPAEGHQAQTGDILTFVLTGLFEHGERRLYEMSSRATHKTTTRKTHEVTQRVEVEVDD